MPICLEGKWGGLRVSPVSCLLRPSQGETSRLSLLNDSSPHLRRQPLFTMRSAHSSLLALRVLHYPSLADSSLRAQRAFHSHVECSKFNV